MQRWLLTAQSAITTTTITTTGTFCRPTWSLLALGW
jgi:hypothetical protein